jgi:hypothetical protein
VIAIHYFVTLYEMYNLLEIVLAQVKGMKYQQNRISISLLIGYKTRVVIFFFFFFWNTFLKSTLEI